MPFLIYPGRPRYISEDDVISWGYDQKVNDATDAHVKANGVFSDDGIAWESFVATIAKPDYEEARALLEDVGVATFRRE